MQTAQSSVAAELLSIRVAAYLHHNHQQLAVAWRRLFQDGIHHSELLVTIAWIGSLNELGSGMSKAPN
jgi:hypothetical protein